MEGPVSKNYSVGTAWRLLRRLFLAFLHGLAAGQISRSISSGEEAVVLAKLADNLKGCPPGLPLLGAVDLLNCLFDRPHQ